MLQIDTLMVDSGVKFGTSGARGLVGDMTDRVCYAYTLAFLQHLGAHGAIQSGTAVAVAGDLRSSTPRIMRAVAAAITDAGHRVINCGTVPSPAAANFGIQQGIASIMVTGSHIPDDRNGIKYNKPSGEILKPDEQAIREQLVEIPQARFRPDGKLVDTSDLPAPDVRVFEDYVDRYTRVFPRDCLRGLRLGLYEHSSVASKALGQVLETLGACVLRLGHSDTFIPVDTEAIRAEDVRLAAEWSAKHNLDALVSTDGDGDRPLISDERGTWLRGDIIGILCAHYLDADAVVTPVSSNSALEKCGWFPRVRRTRIGSPFVIAGMDEESAAGASRVVGYEANGGFLLGSALEIEGNPLPALPTRDTLIVILAVLVQAAARSATVSTLLSDLPARYTTSDRLKDFPTLRSNAILDGLCSGSAEADLLAVEAVFGADFGEVRTLDTTDGLRITFADDAVVHLRPSGNAPEFRCYNEAESESRAAAMNRRCLEIMNSWRDAEA